MEKFRVFLKNEFAKRQNRHAGFSLRSYARWLGISPAQISQILSGKRAITPSTFKKIGHKFNLSPMEMSDFQSNVDTLNSSKATPRSLHEDQFRLIADWFHLAILSASKLKKKSSDPRWLAAKLEIPVTLINDAMTRLKRMNLLQTHPELEQIGEPIYVTSAQTSKAIQRYHMQQLDLAKQKLEALPLERREFQSLIFACDEKELPIVKSKINRFLEEMQSHSKDKGDHLCTMNLQFFTIIEGDTPKEKSK